MRHLYYAVILSIFIVQLSGCSLFSDSAPTETPVKLSISASDNINPSQLSKANPVVLKFYQLSAIDAFESAQMLDLYKQDATILAKTLIKRQTISSILPKEQRQITLALQPGTKFLAVFAQFSNYSQAKTKAWLDISKIDDLENITLSIESLTINMQVAVEDSFWSW